MWITFLAVDFVPYSAYSNSWNLLKYESIHIRQCKYALEMNLPPEWLEEKPSLKKSRAFSWPPSVVRWPPPPDLLFFQAVPAWWLRTWKKKRISHLDLERGASRCFCLICSQHVKTWVEQGCLGWVSAVAHVPLIILQLQITEFSTWVSWVNYSTYTSMFSAFANVLLFSSTMPSITQVFTLWSITYAPRIISFFPKKKKRAL